jgi:cold shock CspA family protein
MLRVLYKFIKIKERRKVSMSETRTYEGTVIWFNDGKGYGFIKPDDEELGQDVFVHYTNIKASEGSYRTLKKDVRVRFNVDNGDKGIQAINVRTI